MYYHAMLLQNFMIDCQLLLFCHFIENIIILQFFIIINQPQYYKLFNTNLTKILPHSLFNSSIY